VAACLRYTRVAQALALPFDMFRSLIVAVVLVLGTLATAQSVSIQLDGQTFKVIGWRPPSSAPAGGWTAVFAVYAGDGDVPPLAGSYAVENATLVFHPKYPLAAGPRYRAVFQPVGAPRVERSFPTVRDHYALPMTRVEHVYPTADVLPSNQLRLYIYFSSPMSRGDAEQRIHLLDDRGQVLPRVFLPGQELWDPNNRRLTMTFDPGRIKRDLTSNRAMGPPIAEGRRYTLVIDRNWRDANGVPLADEFRKTFRGGAAMRVPPDPKSWKIAAPTAGSRDPLIVEFGRSMNYTLLQRMLRVAGAAGDVVGTIGVDRKEAEWRFTPQSAWRGGTYRLVVDTSIEDLAGNKIAHPFDIDVFDTVTERITTTTMSLPFQIRSAP
jgi:hypothetical protein